MRKIIIFLLILLIYTAFKTSKELNAPPYDDPYNDQYILDIPENAKYYIEQVSDEIILTPEEITSYNATIKSKTSSIYDLNISSLTKAEVLKMLEKYPAPALPKYDNKTPITPKDINAALANRNLSNLPEIIYPKRALTTNRTNLKSLPTTKHFYSTQNLANFDAIQETELHLNEPVLVLHQSLDSNFVLVISTTYIGWIPFNDIVYANEDQLDYFTNTKFGIITKPLLKIDNLLLDMSTKLPYLGVNKNGYEFAVPAKDSQDNLIINKITIPQNSASIGYLPYTKPNLYALAFAYEGTPYKWGGEDNGVDCSSYVANIYRVFGFIFPRNTSDQKDSVGKISSLKNLTNNAKLELLQKNYPSLLYQNGHVLIYLGQKDTNYMVISASGNLKNMQVTTETLNSSNYLSNIDRFISVE